MTEEAKNIIGIVNQEGYDTETGQWGVGYSPDNGKNFYVQENMYGRKYRSNDAIRIGNLVFDQIKLRSPNKAVFSFTVSDDGELQITKVAGPQKKVGDDK